MDVSCSWLCCKMRMMIGILLNLVTAITYKYDFKIFSRQMNITIFCEWNATKEEGIHTVITQKYLYWWFIKLKSCYFVNYKYKVSIAWRHTVLHVHIRNKEIDKDFLIFQALVTGIWNNFRWTCIKNFIISIKPYQLFKKNYLDHAGSKSNE